MINFNSDDMMNALSNISPAVSARPTIPILGNVMLIADGSGTCTVTGTNLDMSIEQEIPCSGAISTTISFQKLKSILQKKKNKQCYIQQGIADRYELKIDRSKFEFDSIHVGDYPIMSTPEYNSIVTVQGRDIHSVAFAASKEDVRYYLQGVFIEEHPDNPSIACGVATDGHVMAWKESMGEVKKPEGTKVCHILPSWLVKAIPNDNTFVDIHLTDTKVSFTVNNTYRVVSKLIDGSYPAWRRVKPVKSNTSVGLSLNLETLLNAVDTASSFSEDRIPLVSFRKAHDSLVIKEPEKGRATEIIDIESGGDGIVEFKVNARYFLDCLQSGKNNNKEEKVAQILYHGQGAPVEVFIGTSSYLIMPVR